MIEEFPLHEHRPQGAQNGARPADEELVDEASRGKFPGEQEADPDRDPPRDNTPAGPPLPRALLLFHGAEQPVAALAPARASWAVLPLPPRARPRVFFH